MNMFEIIKNIKYLFYCSVRKAMSNDKGAHLVKNYLDACEENNLKTPTDFFKGIIAPTSEKLDHQKEMKRYGRYLLTQKALKLMEQGQWYLKESFDHDLENSFFEKKLVKSKLCKEQFEQWVNDVQFIQDSVHRMSGGICINNKIKIII